MRQPTNRLTAAFSMALLLGIGGTAFSQHEAVRIIPGGLQHQGMMHGESREEMMKNCRMMKNRHQGMMSRMEAADRELESLAAKMKAADSQDQKVQVMEDLLAKLVETRTQMHEGMMNLMPQMMQHMAQHMQMSQESGDSSMMGCPMMSGHDQPSEGSGTEDRDHQH